MLRNAQDKRARKLAKKRVRLLSILFLLSSGWLYCMDYVGIRVDLVKVLLYRNSTVWVNLAEEDQFQSLLGQAHTITVLFTSDRDLWPKSKRFPLGPEPDQSIHLSQHFC